MSTNSEREEEEEVTAYCKFMQVFTIFLLVARAQLNTVVLYVTGCEVLVCSNLLLSNVSYKN